MHDGDSQAAELLKLIKGLQREMEELFGNIKETNEKMVSRLERSVQTELNSLEKRIEQFAHGQELTSEQGPAENPDRIIQDYERHLTPPR